MELLNELQQDWKWRKLGDIAQTSSGGTPSRGNKNYYGGNIAWLKSGELPDGEIYSSEESITEEGVYYSSAKVFPEGTLLMAMYGATVGKLGILAFPAATNQAVCAITPSEYLDKYYLFYWLLNIRKDLINASFGGAQPNISQTVIQNLDLPLPSIIEQRQIAAKLKAQLAEVETARKALEIQENDVNKLEIQLLESIFAQSKPEKILKIGDVAVTTSGSTPSRDNKEYWQDGCYAWVKTGEVVNKPIFKTEESISEKAIKECSVTLLPPKTVLIAMYGQGKTRGQSAVLEIPATTNQACFAILPNETFYPEYLQYWLKNSYSNLRSLSEGRGGNQANLNGAMLKDFTVPFISKDG